MIVSALERRETATEWVLSARVDSEAAPQQREEVWFRWPREIGSPATSPATGGDPLLPAFFAPAMALHEDLHIDDDVSPELVEAATQRIESLQLHDFERVRAAKLHCQPPPTAAAVSATDRPSRTACFFSGGLDSWHSAVRRRTELETLLFIQGFEYRPDNAIRSRVGREHVRRCAEFLDVELLTVTTNLRPLAIRVTKDRLHTAGRPFVGFGTHVYLGAYLVAIALTARHLFSNVIVPCGTSGSSTARERSSPVMEPNWSTSAMAFESDGSFTNRVEKMRYLAGECPEALDLLRVCVAQRGADLNCGRCGKSVRMLAELRVAGVSHLSSVFAQPLDLADIRPGICIRNEHWAVVGRAAAQEGDRKLASTIRRFLRGSPAWRRPLGRLKRRLLSRGA